jgi:hypothetical protein
MSEQAKGTLTISNWDEAPYQQWDAETKLVQAHITGSFSGDFEGAGSSEILMDYTSPQTASFVGLQLVDGKLGGRAGRFVLQMNGSYEGGTATVSWSVVPGSGTGELAGLAGHGGYTAGPADYPDVTVTLEYELG